MLTPLKRNIKTGWTNFVRNFAISIASCFIIGMTIFLISSLFLMRDVSNFLIANLEEKVDISIYFKEESNEEDIIGIKEEIAKLPEVREVQYISKTEALERFLERYKNNPIVIESLMEVGNPLLPTLNVKAWEATQYEAVVSFLEISPQKELIDKIDYHERKPVIERIFSITSTVNVTGLIFALILAIIAILVAFNQIRLAIYNSREEIKIQRLVGASNWFIRGPFLIQGAISGVFAAVATLFIFAFAVFLLTPNFTILFPGLNIFSVFLGKFWLFLLLQLFIGIGLGVVSGVIAIHKFLET